MDLRRTCRTCVSFQSGSENATIWSKQVNMTTLACEFYAEEKIVDALMRLFVSRSDTYAIQREDGTYVRLDEPLTREVLKHHLAGEITIGAYQISPIDNMVKWLVFDVDPEHVKEPQQVALSIHTECASRFYERVVLLEASRHPDPSFHVWVFFEPENPAKAARWLGHKILGYVGVAAELFPKQDVVNPGDFGNLVKLPLGFHRKDGKWSRFLDPITLKPLLANCLYDVKGCSFSERDLRKICELADRDRDRRGVQIRLSPLPTEIRSIVNEDEVAEIATLLARYWRPGYRNQLEMSFLGWCLKRGVSYESAYRIVDQVATSTNDEERTQRLELVRYHYQNRRGLGPKLKGLSGLVEVIRRAINDEGVS